MSHLLPLTLLLGLYYIMGAHEYSIEFHRQFAQVQYIYQSDRIPISILPAKTSLRPGDYVIISVSDVWSTSDLIWKTESSMIDHGYLSEYTGPTVVYTAPNETGDVVIRVYGTMGEIRRGEGWITLSVRP